MGQQQSKDELLYQQVNYGNAEGIKALRSQGAGLEWIDRDGKTPLVASCMNPELYNVAKTLIELGANVNAYRPGRHAGTPLHHAAKRGLDQTVKLLLSHGANPLVMNDDCQTPLDVARVKGYNNVVRAIEDHVCLFSGWLLELYGPGFLTLLAPQLLSRKVWVVVLPCGSRNLRKPLKLELAVYAGAQDAQPRIVIPLWKSNLQEPNFNLPDPAAIISDVSKNTRIKLTPLSEAEKEQLRRFCNACKGIPQVVHPSMPLNNTAPSALASAPEIVGEENLAAVSSDSDPSTGPYSAGSSSIHNDPNTDETSRIHKSKCEVEEGGPSTIPAPNPNTLENHSFPTPSAPPALDTDDSQIHYPPIDLSPLDLSSEIMPSRSSNKKEDGSSSSCTICLDAPLQGACIPCGHLAGCMSCLNEIKDKQWGCPVCRAKINQVVRIYAV